MFIVAKCGGETQRSIDILGLGAEYERNYLSKIMPGISVLTTRFGYMGFICWAIDGGIDPKSDSFHTLEYALAKTEYNLKKDRYKGVRNIKRGMEPPYYQQSVFGDYRNTMMGMGVLTKKNELTDEGVRLAKEFQKSRNKLLPPSKIRGTTARKGFDVKKSLLRLSDSEKKLYKKIFFSGVNGNKETEGNARTRRAHRALYGNLIRELDNLSSGDADGVADDKADYAAIEGLRGCSGGSRKYALANEMSHYLRAVYCSITALHDIVSYLKDDKVKSGAKSLSLTQATGIKRVRKHLEEARKIAATLKKRRAGSRANELIELCSVSSIEELLRRLIKRNMDIKGERAWVDLKNSMIVLNPADPFVPRKAAAFGYRLLPYASLMKDLH
ncbi:MAG: hypothetical protein QY316_03785 [Thermodesulfobacteriota bacterium]|nr:MAG: hypothetical protein QY316_03785 [Thermodesulfobacteriota bacterium]